jgi:hypothetical protein
MGKHGVNRVNVEVIAISEMYIVCQRLFYAPNYSTIDCFSWSSCDLKKLSLLFGGQLDGSHYDNLLPVEEKKKLAAFDEI